MDVPPGMSEASHGPSHTGRRCFCMYPDMTHMCYLCVDRMDWGGLTSVKSPSSVQTCTSQGTFGWVVGYMVDERVVVSSRYENESETTKNRIWSAVKGKIPRSVPWQRLGQRGGWEGTWLVSRLRRLASLWVWPQSLTAFISFFLPSDKKVSYTLLPQSWRHLSRNHKAHHSVFANNLWASCCGKALIT